MKRDYPPNEGQGAGERAGGPAEPPREGQSDAGAREAMDPDANDADANDAEEGALDLSDGDLAAPDEMGALRDEITGLNEKILRLAAELENTRRRAEREKQDAGRYAIANFARDLLGVTDAFEGALASAPADDAKASVETLSAIVSGIRLAENSMIAVLERHGVRRINPKGERFDPNLHQAVAQAPGEAPAGHVLEVAQPGFVIGERTLRAAMVVVSTGPAAKSAEEPAENPSPDAPEDGPPVTGARIDTRV